MSAPTSDTISVRDEPSGVHTILVKGSANVHEISGAILHAIRAGHPTVQTRAVGAGAVNQAAKACAIAVTLAGKEGLELTFAPGFQTIRMDGEDRHAIVFKAVVHTAG
jgi:stage V sporulation protein S